MTRNALLFVFVAVFAFAGIAAAEVAPPLAPVQPAAISPSASAADVSQPVASQEAFDLFQVFASPKVSSGPAPTFKSCKLSECRAGCQIPGCVSYCISLETCECDAICG